MGAILAVLPTILQLVPLAVTASQSFMNWVVGLRASAQATKEWTPELEAAFVNWLIALATSRAWQTDASLAAGGITTTIKTEPTPAQP